MGKTGPKATRLYMGAAYLSLLAAFAAVIAALVFWDAHWLPGAFAMVVFAIAWASIVAYD